MTATKKPITKKTTDEDRGTPSTTVNLDPDSHEWTLIRHYALLEEHYNIGSISEINIDENTMLREIKRQRNELLNHLLPKKIRSHSWCKIKHLFLMYGHWLELMDRCDEKAIMEHLYRANITKQMLTDGIKQAYKDADINV